MVGDGGVGRPRDVNQGDLSDGIENRAGVRAPVVAKKGRNGPGAKGVQEGGRRSGARVPTPPARVPETAKQAGVGLRMHGSRTHPRATHMGVAPLAERTRLETTGDPKLC